MSVGQAETMKLLLLILSITHYSHLSFTQWLLTESKNVRIKQLKWWIKFVLLSLLEGGVVILFVCLLLLLCLYYWFLSLDPWLDVHPINTSVGMLFIEQQDLNRLFETYQFIKQSYLFITFYISLLCFISLFCGYDNIVDPVLVLSGLLFFGGRKKA